MPSNIVKYEHNYLTNVIVQLDFDSVAKYVETVPNDIIEALKEEYNFHQQMLSDFKINVVTGARIQTAIPLWEFSSKDNNLLIQLTQNSLKFNCVKYTHFENLIEKINKVIELLKPDISLITRLGLRYVNQIDLEEPNPVEWSNYIDDALICSINNWCSNSKNKISRAMNQIVIADDDYTLNFNYGIYNPIFPNPIIQKQYILDFDCSDKNVEFNDVSTKLKSLNEIITKSFEKSIKDGLRDKMGVIRND